MDETTKEQEKCLKGKAWSQEFKALAGAWKDLPTTEEIRKPLGQDNLRSNRVAECN